MEIIGITCLKYTTQLEKKVRLAGLGSEVRKIKVKDITLYIYRNDMLEIEHLRIDLHLRLKKKL